MKKLITLLVAITSMLSLPSAVEAQERIPRMIDAKPISTMLDNAMLYRNSWKNGEAFRTDKEYVEHMSKAQQQFEKAVVGKFKDSVEPHRITVIIYGGAKWNVEENILNISDMLDLPQGSQIELCSDCRDPRPKAGVHSGTTFTILLPSNIYSWDYMGGYYGKFAEWGMMYIDPKCYAFSTPPTVNDTMFVSGKQTYLNGSVANIVHGVINMSMYWYGFVPRKYSRIGLIDSGVDTTHKDIGSDRIDLISSYNIAHGNKNVTDSAGHGTGVASVMWARTNNHYGLASIASNDTLVVYKVFAGNSISGPTSYVTAATNNN